MKWVWASACGKTADFPKATPQGPSPTRTKVNKQVTLLSVPPEEDTYLSWLLSLPLLASLSSSESPSWFRPPPHLPSRCSSSYPDDGPADKVGKSRSDGPSISSAKKPALVKYGPGPGAQGQHSRPPHWGMGPFLPHSWGRSRGPMAAATAHSAGWLWGHLGAEENPAGIPTLGADSLNCLTPKQGRHQRGALLPHSLPGCCLERLLRQQNINQSPALGVSTLD